MSVIGQRGFFVVDHLRGIVLQLEEVVHNGTQFRGEKALIGNAALIEIEAHHLARPRKLSPAVRYRIFCHIILRYRILSGTIIFCFKFPQYIIIIRKRQDKF